MSWETVSYIATGATFAYTIGKDFFLWVFSLFNPYKSSAAIRFSDNNTKMHLSVSIQNKKENFIITESPNIEFVSGFCLFNHIFCERKITNKEYEKNKNKSTVNENTNNHIFQYDLGFLDYVNLKTYNKIYVKIATNIDSESKPKTFIHLINNMFKHKINRTNYDEFTKNTKDKLDYLINYKHDLTPEEIKTKYGLMPPS